MNTNTATWPVFIISLVLAFIAITWWSLDRAASEVSAVTDADYYSHGLRYNHTHREQKAGEELGWTVSPELVGRLLTIRVADSHQAGISGCQGTITFPNPAAGQGTAPSLTVAEKGRGLYTVEVPATLAPTLAATLTLSKGEATLERRLLLAL